MDLVSGQVSSLQLFLIQVAQAQKKWQEDGGRKMEEGKQRIGECLIFSTIFLPLIFLPNLLLANDLMRSTVLVPNHETPSLRQSNHR